MAAQREWWLNNVGQNLLAGVTDSTTNPPALPDDYILDFLTRIPEARESFNRLLGNMLPAEQVRLEVLSEMAALRVTPEKDVSDNLQRTLNTAGIHTTGPYGGTRS